MQLTSNTKLWLCSLVKTNKATAIVTDGCHSRPKLRRIENVSKFCGTSTKCHKQAGKQIVCVLGGVIPEAQISYTLYAHSSWRCN